MVVHETVAVVVAVEVATEEIVGGVMSVVVNDHVVLSLIPAKLLPDPSWNAVPGIVTCDGSTSSPFIAGSAVRSVRVRGAKRVRSAGDVGAAHTSDR